MTAEQSTRGGVVPMSPLMPTPALTPCFVCARACVHVNVHVHLRFRVVVRVRVPRGMGGGRGVGGGDLPDVFGLATHSKLLGIVLRLCVRKFCGNLEVAALFGNSFACKCTCIDNVKSLICCT